MPARGAAQRWLQNIWYEGAPAPWTLRVLAGLYGAAVRLRAAAYRIRVLRRHSAGRPVIVVGNLTVGGSGKTPLVIWVCEQLVALGLRPGVVLRGYGGSAERGSAPQVVTAQSDARVVGDEALLLAHRTAAPIVVGRDRVAAARELARRSVDVIVADDGLQHLRLQRDLELVVIDAVRGLGNGRLLPAGPLRESDARLGAVQALILNGNEDESPVSLPTAAANIPRFRMRLTGDRLVRIDAQVVRPLASLAGSRVHAVAGIGHPARFFRQLSAAGLVPIEHAFPDHHVFQRDELTFHDELPLLMTEKDAVKCRSLGLQDAWVLPVSASFADSQAAALREILRAVTMH